jgi:hypothetical protein
MGSPTQEPMLMIRPPLFRCSSAASVAIRMPRRIEVDHAIEFIERAFLE